MGTSIGYELEGAIVFAEMCSSVSNIHGDNTLAINNGKSSSAKAVGKCTVAINRGNYGTAEVKGENSIAASYGKWGAARGTMGSWLVLAEWVLSTKTWSDELIGVKCVKVDGEKIKPNIFYTLENGKIVKDMYKNK